MNDIFIHVCMNRYLGRRNILLILSKEIDNRLSVLHVKVSEESLFWLSRNGRRGGREMWR